VRTAYEIAYVCIEPFRQYFYRRVRSDLRVLVRAYCNAGRRRVRLLDVGARNSRYTVGLQADITLLDRPPLCETHASLNLGVTDDILGKIRKRRSNVIEYAIRDIVCDGPPEGVFDIVAAIEVLEHIENDAACVHNIASCLRPGGSFYMTTPNGLAVRRTNPDHVRHYTGEELRGVLCEAFDDVQLFYAVRESRNWRWAEQGWSRSRPIVTLKSMAGAFMNALEPVRFPAEAQHLIAVCTMRA